MAAITLETGTWLKDPARKNPEGEQALADLLDQVIRMRGGASYQTYTIAGGVLTPETWVFDATSEGGTGTDDLVTISGTNYKPGDRIYLAPASGQTLTVKPSTVGGAANIRLFADADVVLDDVRCWLKLVWTGSFWDEVGFFHPNLTKYRAHYGLAYATSSTDGLIQLATPAEARGSVGSQALTPANMAANFVALDVNNKGIMPLPGGLILQWGYDASGSTGVRTITYKEAFPTGLIVPFFSPVVGLTGNRAVILRSDQADFFTLTQMKVQVVTGSDAGSGVPLHWLVLGY